MTPELKFLINARPRTGGTLLATMLNSHHTISMGYEMYPQLLSDKENQPYLLDDLIQKLDVSRNDDARKWVQKMEKNNFRTFVARARRSGLEPKTVLTSLKSMVHKNSSFESLESKLEFIEALLITQALQDSKPIVGTKMRADLNILHSRHPRAVFLMMLRDGRDMFASLKNKGQFQVQASQLAIEWQKSLIEFESFIAQSDVTGMLIKYEELVAHPKETLSELLQLASLTFDESMTKFEQQPQSLFNNAHGHLSAVQLADGLNEKSIGRWKTDDLSPAELEEFEAKAKPTLERYGYL